MKITSILNNVIGPVMPGSSSSHTAGPYHIAKTCRSIVGDAAKVIFTFAPKSSIAECYLEQGSDLAFIMGILDLPLTDPRFKDAHSLARELGTEIRFVIEPFREATHPNSTRITASAKSGKNFEIIADSIGGGSFVIRKLNGEEVNITGDNDDPKIKPVFHPLKGERLFSSAADIIAYTKRSGKNLASAGLDYESCLLGIPREELDAEMDTRLQIMLDAVKLGLSDNCPEMFLLARTAGKIFDAESNGKLALGGVNTRAAIRAMAAMQVNSGQGIVCAAPTGGSAGVIPGVIATMLEDLKFSRHDAVSALWAAGAIGMIVDTRATFAAEVAGCQVEIAAAGAMAAAAVADRAGGTVNEACDAAAIIFQNGMGLVCDLIQGTVEIPCHTRNASFASQAFICADLAMGGYINPVGLDETIDAVFAVGKMLPVELRCTSLGGLAAAPSALSMEKNKIK